MDLNWNFTYLNKKAEELFNKPPGYLLGKNMWTEFPKEKHPAFYDASYHVRETQQNVYLKAYSYAVATWLETTIYPSPTGVTVYFKDISGQIKIEEDLKILEAAIQEQKIQEKKRITRVIITSQEKERNHIGCELHDNINQILAGSKIYLSLACNKNKEVKELIKYPMELIDTSIEEIRTLSHKLVTPARNINLKELVTGLLIMLNQKGTIKTRFTYTVPVALLSDELKLNIYRIMQEAINNIMKYAEAKNVNIIIELIGGEINITIEDDGKGFDIEKKRDGIGISNMMSRIDSFNGKINIETALGKGCRTRIEIPC